MESLIHDVKKSNEIIFVCSGNIIRSAFAEIYAKQFIKDKLIRSLGTDYHNSQIHPKTKLILLEKGIDRVNLDSFRPTHISEVVPTNMENTIFLNMTNQHKERLQSYFGSDIRSYLLLEVQNERKEIEDPYFSDNYEMVFSKIEECVIQLAKYCIN